MVLRASTWKATCLGTHASVQVPSKILSWHFPSATKRTTVLHMKHNQSDAVEVCMLRTTQMRMSKCDPLMHRITPLRPVPNNVMSVVAYLETPFDPDMQGPSEKYGAHRDRGQTGRIQRGRESLILPLGVELLGSYFDLLLRSAGIRAAIENEQGPGPMSFGRLHASSSNTNHDVAACLVPI